MSMTSLEKAAVEQVRMAESAAKAFREIRTAVLMLTDPAKNHENIRAVADRCLLHSELLITSARRLDKALSEMNDEEGEDPDPDYTDHDKEEGT